ncbi:MAG: tRNA lysidine(34) synthetase TilS [Acidobacteria bacterium]|nr:tRNA lysidine(34) synthetase TilS [Acidobacteriota bacterium]
MPVVDRVGRFIRQHALAGPATRVVLAVSGGSDSIALAHLMRALAAGGALKIAGVAHFNHQLRPAADDDERFVREAAAALGWPFVVEREDVAARARAARRSVEHAAHVARHAFFERACDRLNGEVVALGHTRDDQAETFLLRLLRGAGARGLGSMRPRRGRLVRPLLACRRAELRAWLDRGRIGFVEDASNADVSIPRNRIRAELVPLLEARFNPNIVAVLAGEADLAREVSEWLAQAADALLQAAARPAPHPSASALDAAAMLAAPSAVRRLAVSRAMERASGGRPVSCRHVERALEVLRAPADRMDAPGHRVERAGAHLIFASRPAGTTGRWSAEHPVHPEHPAQPVNLFSYPLSIPGEVELIEAGCRLTVECAAGPGDAVASSGSIAIVRADRCAGPLTVRGRRPGDRFRPVGLGGRKKLQDLFVDRRVPRGERDRVPLVVDAADRIVWVAGYGIDEAFRVSDPSQAVLILKLTHL